MDLPNKNLENMLTTRFLEDFLKRGGYYIVNNNVNNPQQQQQRCQLQKPTKIPNHHHHHHHHQQQRRYGHVIANDQPLAMNNGSRVIYKNRAGPTRPCTTVQRVHGAMLPVWAVAPPCTVGVGVKEIEKSNGHGGVDLGLLKEEENVPEGIDLSLKLWFN